MQCSHEVTGDRRGVTCGRWVVPGKLHFIKMQIKDKISLNFQVQQVAVNLVVDVGVIFLLAQI